MKYIEKYAQISSATDTGLRQITRRLALEGLSFVDIFLGRRKSLKVPRVQFLYIHHVFKDEEQGLRDLLAYLARDHKFISYSEAVNRVLNGTVDAPYIAVSSDDGFKNNLRAGKICREFGISACFFVNPGVIGQQDEARIAAHCRDRLNFPPVEFLDWNDVETLQKGGHEIGSHTMDHMRVSAVSASAFEEDCKMSRSALVQHCGHVEHFAFPYGRFRDFNENARRIVFNSGFRSCASAERGCHVSGKGFDREELCIRRDHVILGWPIRHVIYFLARNSRLAERSDSYFPYPRT